MVRSVTAAGYFTPKEIQSKTLSRIIGGQDIIAIAPEGSGKTTAYILGVLMRLKYGFEEAPRALILVPDKEKVLEVIEKFNLLNQNTSIRVVGLYSEPSMQNQLDALNLVVTRVFNTFFWIVKHEMLGFILLEVTTVSGIVSIIIVHGSLH